MFIVDIATFGTVALLGLLCTISISLGFAVYYRSSHSINITKKRRKKTEIELQKKLEEMVYARIVVISANVESLLEEPSKAEEWCKQVGKEIADQKPVFAALHLQGAKSAGRGSSDAVDQIINHIDRQPGFELFQNSRHFHDMENFGLSSIYYWKNEPNAALYDNDKSEYRVAQGHMNEPLKSGNIKRDRLSDGYQQMSGGQSPPSYALTRWLLFDKPFNFINIALRPDPSPLDGCTKWPSEIVLERRKQIKSLIDGLKSKNLWDDDATFIAGDFNFSINKENFLREQAASHHATISSANDGVGKLAKVEASGLEKKLFLINNNKFDFQDLHDWLFTTCNGRLIKKFDQEIDEICKNHNVVEPTIYFQPNFPCGFNKKLDQDFFLRTTCPSWKNRILANHKAWHMMHYVR